MVGNSDEILLRESGGHGSPKERWNISARSLTFKCLIHADSVRYRVTFFFNDTKNNSLSCQTGTCGNLETSTTKQEQKNQTQPYMKCNCTTWEIYNVTSANNGFYSCETVTEIPDLRTNKSTQVEVFIGEYCFKEYSSVFEQNVFEYDLQRLSVSLKCLSVPS